jgi:ABC-2 type transport system permease protein
MGSFWGFITHVSAFFRKEWAEILRQPRLILTLILGPFLILFLFGIGYRNQARPVRTVFVAPENSTMRASIQQYASTLGSDLIFEGFAVDKNQALQMLANGQVDMVVVPPTNVDSLIRNNQQATFTLYDNEIDPAQVSYIQYLGTAYIDEVNRRVLSQFASQAQTNTKDLPTQIQQARANDQAMKNALVAGDMATAQARQQDLNNNLGVIAATLTSRAIFAKVIQSETGASTGQDNLSQLAASLNQLQSVPNTGGNANLNSVAAQQDIQRLDKTDQQLAQLQSQLQQFQSISPNVLVSPFRSETRSIAPLSNVSPVIFFTPAVVALLVQHMAVTFGSLSIVRERLSGTMELFRVSPISPFETLLGKYLSYMSLGFLLSGILLLLIYYALGVPFLGGWLNVIWVTLALLFVSLGIGFFISLIAQNESQAVQLAMISLLISVFFSGMFLDLRYLAKPVQIVSFLTPATYGRLLYQDIMLRGDGIVPLYIAGLIFIGLFFFLLSLRRLRKEMKLG